MFLLFFFLNKVLNNFCKMRGYFSKGGVVHIPCILILIHFASTVICSFLMKRGSFHLKNDVSYR